MHMVWPAKLFTVCYFMIPSFTAGLPNLFSVAGHFHMRKFIAGHKRFCDITTGTCDKYLEFDKFYAITRGDNGSYSCTQCCQLVWV